MFQVMIYLIEGVLPESYFANNLRGLSVDMIVFRDLLKLRLPILSKHLEVLQNDAREGRCILHSVISILYSWPQKVYKLILIYYLFDV